MSMPTWTGPAPAGIVIGLDDTLFPRAAYLYGASRAVGRAGAAHGLDSIRLSRVVRRQFLAGSDRGGAIDRALAAYGLPPDRASELIPGLTAALTGYRPRKLPLYPGAADALAALTGHYPVACLTDGDPAIQWAKLAATGLTRAFRTIVITGELRGPTARNPHPVGLRRAAETLGLDPAELVVIGDQPGRDVAVAVTLGARSIRVQTGEYAQSPDEPPATVVVPDLLTAAGLLVPA